MIPARVRRRDRSMAINDKAFAETVRLSFLKNGVVDPDRPMREIDAILRVGGGKETSVGGGLNTAWRTRIVAQRAELHIDRTRYPDLVFRTNDAVRANARPGQPWFEVAAVDDRGDGRLVIQLREG
jgi:hypothetical protein